jgi:hypothetical protein
MASVKLRPQSEVLSANRAYVVRSTRRLGDEAEALLRDVAYVLHLTRRVKADILQEHALAQAEENATAL